MSSSKYACLLALAFTLLTTCSGLSYNDTCENQFRERGHCVLVKQCKSVLNVMRKEVLTNDDVQFLYESQCGRLSDGKVLVCCAQYSLDFNAPSGNTFPAGVRVESTSVAAVPEVAALLPKPGVCGIPDRTNLPISSNTDPGEFPWTILLHYGNTQYQSNFSCGGVLISDRYVLTAAHCVEDQQFWPKLMVRLGEWDVESAVDCQVLGDSFLCSEPEINVPVEKVIVHEGYSRQGSPRTNDIALLRLDQPIAFTEWVAPICLLEGEEITNVKLTTTGWSNNECGNPLRMKMKLGATLLDDAECKSVLPDQISNSNAFLCTKSAENGETSSADAGGGLIAAKLNALYLVGITSSIVDCPSNSSKTVFTRVDPHYRWIVSKLER